MGADLVQVYTALVFAGPRFFARLAREATRPPKSV
jgi:dihydroorotate dehydrogenase